MNLLRNIFGTLLAIILLAFALQNRHDVALTMNPLGAPALLPLYAIVLAVFAAGFILGGFMVWVNTAPERRFTRRQRKALTALETELAHIKNVPTTSGTPSSELFPALPPR